MNLGLAFLNQIRDGYVRRTLDQLITNIRSGYSKQHNADDTHGTITASGSISERLRAVALGAWASIPFAATLYTATGTTWTVTNTQQTTLKYSLIGTTLFVVFSITASSVGGATANLFLTLPLNASATVAAYGTCVYNDNGTYGTGVIFAPTGTTSPQLKLMKNLGGTVNWSNSSALTIAGHMAFEVSGSI